MIALTTTFAILGSDLDRKCDAGVQVDEKDEFGCEYRCRWCIAFFIVCDDAVRRG
jgi:hypothetical protein